MECDDKMILEMDNTINAKVGEKVKLTLNRGVILAASFIVYILPLVGFAGAIILGQKLFPDAQIIVLIMGFVGLFACFAVSKWFDLYFHKKQKIKIGIEKMPDVF